MSDDPEQPRVAPAPLGGAPAVVPETTVRMAARPDAPAPMTAKPETAPMNPRPATQMSASAVPSTLESPQAADNGASVVARPAGVGSPDEIHGALLVSGAPAGSAAHVLPPMGDATMPEAGRRVGPATMMSPAVVAPLTGEPTPPLTPENAVVDVGAPAHAFVPHGSVAPAFGGSRGRGGERVGGAARPTSTTFLVLLVGGIVAAVALLAVVVIAVVFLTRGSSRGSGPRRSRQPSTASTSASDSPRFPPAMGGTRSRVSVTSAGVLDPEAVRAVVNSILPRLDACFAASELEPPNHESVSYELDVAPNGEVRRAEPPSAVGRSAKLDTCMTQNLRSLRMPRALKGSAVRLLFVAPIEAR